MTDQQLDERLRRWYAGELDAADVPPALWIAIADIPDTVPAAPRTATSRPVLLLAAALILLLTMAGAMVVGSGVLDPDRALPDALDPAGLDPCAVLPGPGNAAVGNEEPITHPAPAIVGGVSCAYGWDDRSSPHFQLRDRPTTTQEAEEIVGRLFSSSSGEPPLVGRVHDGRTWLADAEWTNPPVEGAVAQACIAMAVSSEPYFFVIWFTCREELPSATSVSMASFQQSGTEVANGVLDNLAALEAGEEPTYRLDRDWRISPP